MTLVTLPYRTELAGGQPEDIGMVLADFDALLAVINGDIRSDNIAAAAAIPTSKLNISGSRDGTKFLRDDDSWQPAPSGVVTLIAHTVLAADAANFDVQSIAGGRHLQMDGYFRSDRASGQDDIGVRFNNDSGNNYNGYMWQASGTSPSQNANESLAASSLRLGNFMNGASATALRFSAVRMIVDHYLNALNHKQLLGSAARASADTTGTLSNHIGGGVWKNGNAINRVTLIVTGGGTVFKAGCALSLYTI